MSEVTIKFRDGTSKYFPEQSRPGGSWTNSVRYEGQFVIFKDVWQKETAYPMDLIQEVVKTPSSY